MQVPILFVGPSLPRGQLGAFLTIEADVRPPIRRGDLQGIPDGAVVGVIDGVFFTQLAVSAREIYELLRRGIRVLGSSSMGALRAAELYPYGMEGVGEIYEMFRRGEIDSDAEVALAFDPDTQRAVSEPLVNVRHCLKRARAAGVVAAEEADALLALARSIIYYELTYPVLFQKAKGSVSVEAIERLGRYVSEHAAEIDLKRQDAVTLIQRLEGAVR